MGTLWGKAPQFQQIRGPHAARTQPGWTDEDSGFPRTAVRYVPSLPNLPPDLAPCLWCWPEGWPALGANATTTQHGGSPRLESVAGKRRRRIPWYSWITERIRFRLGKGLGSAIWKTLPVDLALGTTARDRPGAQSIRGMALTVACVQDVLSIAPSSSYLKGAIRALW
ncbi:hypothetical protein S7711_10505 [Stachybotrys chartarum IBT 7711]|uniref:Uncharacterized protein n=1 Tax=Stachybotrys chartarum (strain CBS 109288 / IBT 7711) TaxID=1280523 RepID=A0A084AVC4_STACB|nr:hypothetical protein S7711_10505 [Stachybotrys chartarum IBT 7711]